MGGIIPPTSRDGSTASHPPFACAIAAGKRSSCARRPSSRIAARTQTTAIVSDTKGLECTVASLVERSSVLDDEAMLVDGAVEDETVDQTSAENSLPRALAAVGDAHDDSLAQRAKFGPDPTMEALGITGALPRSATDGSD
jgi:hypothetical protein